MSELDEMVQAAANRAVVKFVDAGGWLLPNYENRIKVPAELYQQAWAAVDQNRLREHITTRIESELADRIMNHLAAEMATDIKQILSVQERREAIRELARKHMVSIMQAGATP